MSSEASSRSARSDVMVALDESWRTVAEIRDRIERPWALSTIRSILDNTSESGEIDGKYARHPGGGTITLYRKVQA